MHFDSESPDAHFEFELRKFRERYKHLGDLINRLALISGMPLRFYLVSRANSKSALLFSGGNFSICNVNENEYTECDCRDELNRWLTLAEKFRTPVRLRCGKGYTVGILEVNLKDFEKYNCVLVAGPILISSDEESEDVLKLPSLSTQSREEGNRSIWKERLLKIKELLEALDEKDDEKKIEKDEDGIESIKEFLGSPRDSILDYTHIPFDVIRSDFLWYGITFKNPNLLRMVLYGKGEELWNCSNGKIESIHLLCSWIEVIMFDKFLKHRVSNVEELSNFNLKLLLAELCEDSSLKVFINGIVRKLLRSNMGVDNRLKEKDLERFGIILEKMQDLLWTNPHLEDVAGELGMNGSALSHWLRRKVGVSFERLKGYYQIEVCAKYLRNSNMSLANIGKRIGIGLESQLSEKFRYFTGFYPTEYRMLYRNFLTMRKKTD